MFKDGQNSGRKCHHSFHNIWSIRTTDTRITNTGYHVLHSYNEQRSAQIIIINKQNGTKYTRITKKHQLHSHNKHRTENNYTLITNTEQKTITLV